MDEIREFAAMICAQGLSPKKTIRCTVKRSRVSAVFNLEDGITEILVDGQTIFLKDSYDDVIAWWKWTTPPIPSTPSLFPPLMDSAPCSSDLGEE